MSGQKPGWTQLIEIFLLAPCIAIAFYLLARGWVTTLQRGEAREKALAQVKMIALAMFLATCIVGFIAFVDVHYIQH
jgi:hypothetical protein